MRLSDAERQAYQKVKLMSRKILVAMLSDKNQAYDVSQALKALSRDADSPFVIHAGAALYKNASGALEVLKEKDRPLLGTVSSAAIGGLIGLLAGPAGAFTGASLGALLGAFRDAFDGALDGGVIQSLLANVGTGSALVIVDVDEETPQAVDALVRACGGTLLRPPAD